MKKLLEGSRAVAEAVKLCRPQVVTAYPITPQTHIIEYLAQFVADGDLAAEFISTESEFAAASAVLGAVAGGVRAFTASASQGLLLMTEVLYNIAGLRLPVVMVCANRAISAPINIFNDHQDSMSMRDAGWIQLYVESNQEALDSIIQAYRISELCELPIMVCMDGFYLTHTFDSVDVPEQSQVDIYLPPFHFDRALNCTKPITLGGGSEADNYLEMRIAQHTALESAEDVIEAIDVDYGESFGRAYGLIDTYFVDNAETVLLTMGSTMGAVRDAVDVLRAQGQSVGALRLRCFRPFPAQKLIAKLRGVKHVIVLEKAFSAGAGGIVAVELRAAFQQAGVAIPIDSLIGGLGGRDLTATIIADIFHSSADSGTSLECRFVDSKSEQTAAAGEG